MSVAVIDCGTNSTRLLIVDEQGRTLVREMRITRLGQGVDATGTLAADALERNYDCLGDYRVLMGEHDVVAARLAATSAARDASNGAEFLAQAARITGATVTLLSGRQEAELSYRGATADLRPIDLPTMIVDIGGGSTELAAQIDGVLWAYSMQIGCVRLAERVLGPGVVTEESLERARAEVVVQVERAISEAPRLGELVGHVRLVGLAGTISTLAQLDAGLSVYHRDAVHHRRLSRAAVARWRGELGAETPAQRLEHPGMVKGREDVLVAGLVVLEGVMDRFEVAELLSSESDILDGMAAEMLASPDGA